MANEAQIIFNPTSTPEAVSTGYQRQNVRAESSTNGIDRTYVEGTTGGVILRVSGPIDVNGVLYSIGTEITFPLTTVGDYIIYLQGSGDNLSPTIALQSAVPSTYDPSKNAFYTDTGNYRVLEWVIYYDGTNGLVDNEIFKGSHSLISNQFPSATFSINDESTSTPSQNVFLTPSPTFDSSHRFSVREGQVVLAAQRVDLRTTSDAAGDAEYRIQYDFIGADQTLLIPLKYLDSSGASPIDVSQVQLNNDVFLAADSLYRTMRTATLFLCGATGEIQPQEFYRQKTAGHSAVIRNRRVFFKTIDPSRGDVNL